MKTTCEFCKREFEAHRSTARFCSSSCRARHCISKPKPDALKEPENKLQTNLRGVVGEQHDEVKIPVFDYRQKKGHITLEGMVRFALAKKFIKWGEKEVRILLEKKERYEKMLYQLENTIELLIKKPNDPTQPKVPSGPIKFINPFKIFPYVEVKIIEEYPSELLKEILKVEKQIDKAGLISAYSAKYNDIRNYLTLIDRDIKLIYYSDSTPELTLETCVFKALQPSNIEYYSPNKTTDNSVCNANKALPEQSNKNHQSKNNFVPSEKIISSRDLAKMEHKSLHFTGDWEYFLGRPSTNFHCAIHGWPGGGKSTLALKFAKYLALNHGVVIYISSEEGTNKTFKDKIIRLDAVIDDLIIADLRCYDDIVKEIPVGKYPFIIIDSLDNMHIDADHLKLLRKRYKNSALITISQVTKDGKMRGSFEIIHDADIEISVINGLATTKKNRFNEPGREYKVY